MNQKQYEEKLVSIIRLVRDKGLRTVKIVPTDPETLAIWLPGEQRALVAVNSAACRELHDAVRAVFQFNRPAASEMDWTMRPKVIQLAPGEFIKVTLSGTVGLHGDVVEAHIVKGNGRVGLAVIRSQPPSKGHEDIVGTMESGTDIGIVGLGSCQLSGVPRHPFSFNQRLHMWRELVGTTVRFLPLVDIAANVDTDDWMNYCLDKVQKQGLPEPTDYYTGSVADARWYMHHFADVTDPVVEKNGRETVYESPVTGRRLHILDRTQGLVMEATDIRSLIERRDDLWKSYISDRIHSYIEKFYPPQLRYPLSVIGDLPREAPIGTTAFRWEDGKRAWYSMTDISGNSAQRAWFRIDPPAVQKPASGWDD